MAHYNVLDVCAQIRQDWAEARMDAGKGKQCPGGYWIAAGKQCGGKREAVKAAAGRIGSAAKKEYKTFKGDFDKALGGKEAAKSKAAILGGAAGAAAGGPIGAIGGASLGYRYGREVNAAVAGAREGMAQAGREIKGAAKAGAARISNAVRSRRKSQP